MTPAFNLIAIIGPTASGKTLLAAHLAQRTAGEVISADSRQVYRHMDLGTGKDYSDYVMDGQKIPVHLIDICDPGYQYSLFEYQRDFFRIFNLLQEQGKTPVLCGGSGLYVEAALKGYRLMSVPVNEPLRTELAGKSPEDLNEILSSMKKLHNKTDGDTKERTIRAIEIEVYRQQHAPEQEPSPRVRPLIAAVCYDRETERRRITERLFARLDCGMVEEVRNLLDGGMSYEAMNYYGLEYRHISRYLSGETGYKQMAESLQTAIHQFAKRQRTFIRKMEKDGLKIHWIAGEKPLDEKIETILGLFTGGIAT